MKSKIALLSLIMFLGFGVSLNANEKKKEKSKSEGYQFTDVISIPHTSIKNQYRSGTCWSFSGLSLIEAEMIRMGKPATDLSEMYVVYYSYLDKAKRYVRMHGKLNFGGGGAFNDITGVMRKYGMVPDTVYTGLQYDEPKHVHGELDDLMASMTNSIIKNMNRKLTKVWPKAIEGALSAYLGEIPDTFKYEGTEYTPKTYMTDYMGINPDDYVMISSYTHHPFYSQFAIEVPDNWSSSLVYNLPLDEMMQVFDSGLENGYSVAWAADVSEKGFSKKEWVAVVPETRVESMSGLEQDKWGDLDKKEQRKALYSFTEPRTEMTITQKLRQEAFDNYETTDDHGMLIVGTAKDQNGTKYYKVKNSWGTDQKYDGYFYASETYVKYKTMSIMVHKDAIPKNLRKKLNIK